MSAKLNALAFGFLVYFFTLTGTAFGEQGLLLWNGLLRTSARPLFDVRHSPLETSMVRNGASLFTGREGTSLFAPYLVRQTQTVRLAPTLQPATQIERVRALIGQAESGVKSYNAVQNGATILPTKRPTEMTIQEIYDWIAETPGQHHAIGHYQFIPATLRRLVDRVGAQPSQLFDKAFQDQLGNILLIEAGLNAFGRGDIERHDLMNNMAKIWAGLPNSTGLSHYEGFAGNHATMTWAYFDQEMGKIFPG